MSNKPLPYAPNFPQSPTKEYEGPSAPPPDGGYPHPHGGVAGMPMPEGQPLLQPGFQPHVYMPPGYPAPAPGPAMTQGFQPGYAYPHPPGAITQQPAPQGPQGAPGGWMTMPQGLSNCPPGLEYLSLIDQVSVHQKVELLEVFVGFENNNKYIVKNALDQKVYCAVEENDCCTRNCCGPARPFDMKVLDNFGKEVMHLSRPLACDSCCFPCCLQRLEVSAPPGRVIGAVEQNWSICQPSFDIKNERNEVVLKIEGPVCTASVCGGDVKFYVYSKDGSTKVGKITKKWSGLAREAFTDADVFGISFPMDLDVRVKAVLLGACFLIDFMYFESANNRR